MSLPESTFYSYDGEVPNTSGSPFRILDGIDLVAPTNASPKAELDENFSWKNTKRRPILVRPMKLPRRDVFQTHKPGETAALDVTGPACELLAFFFADKPVHAFVAKHGLDAVAHEYATYREERIFKLLIEIATSYRLVSWRLPADKRAKERQSEVGSLYLDDNDAVPLHMHEACNKIIHAREFALETRKIRRVPLTYIRDDTVLATGKKGNQEWVVYLWIPEFCEAALDMPLLDAIPFSGLTKRSSQPPPDDEVPF